MTEPFEISPILKWFDSLLANFSTYIPYLLIFGVGLCIISLIFTFYKRYSRQNAELVSSVLVIFCFLAIIVFLAQYFEIELF